jgi:hypothetical protein
MARPLERHLVSTDSGHLVSFSVTAIKELTEASLGTGKEADLRRCLEVNADKLNGNLFIFRHQNAGEI